VASSRWSAGAGWRRCGRRRGDRDEERRASLMADVAYAALTIGIFGLLALMLRGLEKLQ
jgi:hypothetical protein